MQALLHSHEEGQKRSQTCPCPSIEWEGVSKLLTGTVFIYENLLWEWWYEQSQVAMFLWGIFIWLAPTRSQGVLPPNELVFFSYIQGLLKWISLRLIIKH